MAGQADDRIRSSRCFGTLSALTADEVLVFAVASEHFGASRQEEQELQCGLLGRLDFRSSESSQPFCLEISSHEVLALMPGTFCETALHISAPPGALRLFSRQ